jgi:hypothetical protein
MPLSFCGPSTNPARLSRCHHPLPNHSICLNVMMPVLVACHSLSMSGRISGVSLDHYDSTPNGLAVPPIRPLDGRPFCFLFCAMFPSSLVVLFSALDVPLAVRCPRLRRWWSARARPQSHARCLHADTLLLFPTMGAVIVVPMDVSLLVPVPNLLQAGPSGIVLPRHPPSSVAKVIHRPQRSVHPQFHRPEVTG